MNKGGAMKKRQESIIIELLETDRPLNIKKLAEKLSCSERTIRNDLKIVEKWLEVNSQSHVLLKRQPGIGTYLEATKNERTRLLALIREYQSEDQKENVLRQNKILLHLLMSQEAKILDELAEEFYESKERIREDLECIRTLIQAHQLELIIEPRIGIEVRGSERQKRSLLAQVIKKGENVDADAVYLQEFFNITEIKIVNKIVSDVDASLLDYNEDYLLSNIVIHILFMIERIRSKSTLCLTEEEWKLINQTKAHQKSQEISQRLNRDLGFSMPEDEIGYLGLHIASLQMNRKLDTLAPSTEINQTVNEIIQLLIENVSEILGVQLLDDELLRRNLKSHLRAAYLRLTSGFHISNPLLMEIKNAYTHLFLVIQIILEEYAETNEIIFPQEEVAYLTVHFKAALERIKKEKKYRAVITCDYGVGVSSFLEAKIKRSLPQIEVIALLSYQELEDYTDKNQVDFVITTKQLPEVEIKQVVVSPMLEVNDLEKIEQFLQNEQIINESQSFDIQHYTNTFLIEPQLEVKTKEACLSFMCEQLEHKGYIDLHYKNSVFEREESSSTQIGDLVAIPHGNTNHVLKSGIFIATLKKPIEWGNGQVQLVLLLALHRKDLGLKETKNLFSTLHELTADKKRLDKLLQQKSQLGVLRMLSGVE